MSNTDRKEMEMQQVRKLRQNGMSLRKIAEFTGISMEQVRAQTKEVRAVKENKALSMEIEKKEACQFCGTSISQAKTGRPRRFCSEECRRSYWSLHRSKIHKNPQHIYTKICPYCHKTFEVYGNKNPEILLS